MKPFAYFENPTRPLLLASISALIVAQIVALTPSKLESNHRPTAAIDPETLIQDDEPSLIPDIPKDQIPEYSVETFQFISVQNGQKQWKLEARKAFLYNAEKLVHSRDVTAYLYNPEGDFTIVTGLEAKYYLNKRDLEIYGNVRSSFPDGFEMKSDYMQYFPNQRHIQIPVQYATEGGGRQSDGQLFQFFSQGLDYDLTKGLITLPRQVKVNFESRQAADESKGTQASNDSTQIESDHCLIHRNKSMAYFTMKSNRPLDKRFVHITQPNLLARSRKAELNYGSYNEVLEYLIAYDDVVIKEVDQSQKALRYATAGQARFDNHRNIIVLTQYPQVYQNDDTVTGDSIVLHKNSDIVEIEHSNAFSEGNEQ